MNAANSNPPAAISGSRERKIILLLCAAAAVHVFIFSCVFPFFNNVDEQFQYDLVVKYSHGHIPSGLEKMSEESARYFTLYNTPEYFDTPANNPGGQFPPPKWRQSPEKIRQDLAFSVPFWQKVMTNYECSQAPLYYAVAGFWLRAGELLGIEGGRLLYWLHFLNMFFVAALVWLGWFTARNIFPENLFLRLGVPALLAFFPQSAFYAIQNDVLSPLCFGAAFICLLNFLRAEIPSARQGIFTGLALAAVFLTKMTNLPLIAVAAAVVLLKIRRLAESGKFRAALPSLVSLALCAGLPMEIWTTWCKYNFGDFTGTAVKIHYLHWTHKPFVEWWLHPIFTPHGLWTFLSALTGTFWAGEISWHRVLLVPPFLDALYTILSFGLRRDCAGRATPAIRRRHPAAIRGALDRLLEFCRAGGALCISFHQLRFSRLPVSVARTSVFHIGAADARRADPVFAALRFWNGLRAEKIRRPRKISRAGRIGFVHARFRNRHRLAGFLQPIQLVPSVKIRWGGRPREPKIRASNVVS